MKTLAYFDSSHDMPEEVIAAAGFIPYKIFGDVHASNAPADQYLQPFFCPAARSFMTQALARSASGRASSWPRGATQPTGITMSGSAT